MNKSYKIFSGTIEGQPFKLILYDNFDNKKVEYRFNIGCVSLFLVLFGII